MKAVDINPDRRFFPSSLLILICMLGGGLAAGAVEYISLDEIEPGMRGYGLTVFSGSRIDTFAVEVVGVQEKARTAGGMILIEVSGHDLARSRVAQGMSGSPIYLDGRLAGALAFGWAASLRALAGVTPVGEMMAMPDEPVQLASTIAAPNGPALSDLSAATTGVRKLAAELGLDPAVPVAGDEPTTNRVDWPDPLSLAWDLIGEVTTGGRAALPRPESWLYRPLSTAGRTAADDAGPGSGLRSLSGGSACAIPLVSGDAHLGVFGTVTWVEDDDVVMMGHPFMQRGPVAWPLAAAEVLTVLPSSQMSFKMGVIGDIVGLVHHDQRAGLTGKLGPGPKLIPVEIALRLPDAVEARNYSFEIVNDRLLTPTLVYWTLYNALLAEGDDASRQTLKYRLETVWSGNKTLAGEPLVLTGTAAGPGAAGSLAAEWMLPVSILLNNPQADLQLESVKAELVLSRPAARARVAGLSGPRRLQPGEETVFLVEIQPDHGERELIELSVVLPGHLPGGGYRVAVASAAELFALEATRVPGRFQAVDLSSILGVLREPRATDTLVLAVLAPGRGTVLPGHELTGLPLSVSRVIRAGNLEAKPALADYVYRQELSLPWVLSGHAIRKLQLTPADETFKDLKRP